MPLTVEIFSTSSSSRDRCIGVTKIPLMSLLQQGRNQTSSDQGQQMYRQQYDGMVEIVDAVDEQTQQPLGYLQYKLCMDDHGPLENHQPGDDTLDSALDRTLAGSDEARVVDHNNRYSPQTPSPINNNYYSAQMPNFLPQPPPPADTNCAASTFTPKTAFLPHAQQHAPLPTNTNTDQNTPQFFIQSAATQQCMPSAVGTDAQRYFINAPPPQSSNVYHNYNNNNNNQTMPAVVNNNNNNMSPAVGQHPQQLASSSSSNNNHHPGIVPAQMTPVDNQSDGAARLTSSFVTHGHTPPARDEATGRVNPGGAGSNVTEHENLLLNELMKLRLQKMEMQAAMELELWKEDEERRFNDYLKQKEQESLKILANEWRRRDKERERLFDERRTSYEEQETKLKDALGLVGTREQQLTSMEKELASRESKLQSEQAALDAHVRDMEQRITKSYEDKLQNEKIITENLRRLLRENEDRLAKVETRVGDKERECGELRERLAERPEHQLRSQMEVLKVEKRELENRVKEAMEQANHYRAQWSKAMADVQRTRDEERKSSGDRIKMLSKEVEHLKQTNKETRAIVTKNVVVGGKSVGGSSSGILADHQPHQRSAAAARERHSTEDDDDDGRETDATSTDEQKQQPQDRSRTFAKQQQGGGGSGGGTVSSAYEESDAESVVTHSESGREANGNNNRGNNNVAFGRTVPTVYRQPASSKHQQRGGKMMMARNDELLLIDDEGSETRARKHELIKLMDERNVLLKTGIYGPADACMIELNKHIRELEVQLIDDGVSIPDT